MEEKEGGGWCSTGAAGGARLAEAETAAVGASSAVRALSRSGEVEEERGVVEEVLEVEE